MYTSLSPMFAPTPMTAQPFNLQALAQSWFQMGMPPPEMFFNFIQQAMANPAFGPQMSPFLTPFATPAFKAPQGPMAPGSSEIHVDMNGRVTARGADDASMVRGMTNLRDDVIAKFGPQDPRVGGLNRAIYNITRNPIT